MPIMSISLFVLIFIMMIFGVPIAVAIGLSSIAILAYFQLIPFSAVPMMLWAGTESFILVAVPFFILAGNLMGSGKISDRLIDFSNAILGWSKGGLGAVNIIASFIFGGISGSSVADTSAIGSLMIPKMIENGYDKDYSAAITVISSTLAVVVPPSILLILMGSIANLSVARLLIGGLLPGALMTGAMLIQNYFIARKRGYGVYNRFSFKNLMHTFLRGIPALGAPIIIIGGIMSGFVTPTEASGLAVFYVLFVSTFILKTMTFKILAKSMIETAKITAAVLFIVAVARLFTLIIIWDRLPQLAASAILSITNNPLLLLLVINIFLLFVGMLIESFVAMLIFVPIFLPVIKSVGINPIHFGVIFVMNLAIGLVTPPFGGCLFSICAIAKMKMERLVKAVLPLYISLIIALFVATLFPQIVLFLPSLVLD